MLWERVQAPWARGGVLRGAALGYRRAPVRLGVLGPPETFSSPDREDSGAQHGE